MEKLKMLTETEIIYFAHILDIKGGFYIINSKKDGKVPRISLQTRDKQLYDYFTNILYIIQKEFPELNFSLSIQTKKKSFEYVTPEYRVEINYKKNVKIILDLISAHII